MLKKILFSLSLIFVLFSCDLGKMGKESVRHDLASNSDLGVLQSDSVHIFFGETSGYFSNGSFSSTFTVAVSGNYKFDQNYGTANGYCYIYSSDGTTVIKGDSRVFDQDIILDSTETYEVSVNIDLTNTYGSCSLWNVD